MNCFAFFLYLFIPSSSGLRILGLFPFQVRSHYAMGEELMKSLAARGHQVDVYTHFPQKRPIPNFKDVSLKGLLPALTNNASFESTIITSIPTFVRSWHSMGDSVCSIMGHPILQNLLENPNDPPYDLIINEIGLTNCYVSWGRHMKVPVIGLVPSLLVDYTYAPFANPISLATDPSIFTFYAPPMSFFERMNNFLIFKYLCISYNYYTRKQDEYVEKYVGPGYPNSLDLWKDVSLVLVNHDAAVSGVKTFSPMVVPVAGLHIVDHNDTLTKEVQDWLDGSSSGCIYFTFGSMARIESFPKQMLSAFYAAFKNIAPVRVLMKIADPKLLPPGLPSNVMTQPWFDQIQILKHKNLKAFVTHGGLLGTQESIYFGVPMIGIPLNSDQFGNIEIYAKKQIAIKVSLNEITKEKLSHALKEILQNPIYWKNMELISKKFKDRPMSPLDTAIYWVEYIHRHGKDALRSPIVDLPWWQASLLDVYGFIITSLILLLLTIVTIVKILFYFLSISKSNSKVKKN